MSTFFPLYDNLQQASESKVLDAASLTQFIQFIKHADSTVHNTVYALIKHHENLELGKVQCKHPYEADVNTRSGSYKFHMERFPPSLQRILITYMHTHTSAATEHV